MVKKILNGPWPAKMALGEKFQALGISEEDFNFYSELFIQNWQRYMTMKDDKGWHGNQKQDR